MDFSQKKSISDKYFDFRAVILSSLYFSLCQGDCANCTNYNWIILFILHRPGSNGEFYDSSVDRNAVRCGFNRYCVISRIV